MFNVGTVLTLTLTLATAVSYVVRPVDVTDYLKLAWLISSMATVGGAIASGLEDEETVRAAAYGYHPEPVGWQDEKDR